MWLLTELKRRNVVRVGIAYLASAWLLVQIAETLLPVYDLPATLIRPFLIILAIGFPVVLIFSWAYEITPGGLKLEKDVDRSTSVTHHTGKKLDRAILIVLTIAIAYFAIDKFLLAPGRDAALEEAVAQQTRSDVFLERFGESSIAVLPFANMSDDPSNEYFSDGISEELLNLLAQIPRLRVISRSTMFQFKGKDVDIRALAEQLDVSHVLEGSVRKAGNQVRVTAQLIEANTDTHLWSNTYDRDLTDIFKIQDEISAEIVASLQDELQIAKALIPTATPSSNMEAYQAFLRGRYFVAKRTRESMTLAVEELKNAIALDPEYAVAHAELAIAYRLQVEGQYGDLTNDESSQLAEPHAELALSLDPELAAAHAALGLLRKNQGRLDEARDHLEEAIRLNPSYSIAYVWLGQVLGLQGNLAEQFSMLNANVYMDPLSIIGQSGLINLLAMRHDFEAARKHLRQLQPLSISIFEYRKAFTDTIEFGWAAGLLGYLNSYRTTPKKLAVKQRIAYLLVAIGLEDEALNFIDPPPWWVLTVVGKHTEAFVLTEADAIANGTEYWDRGMGFVLASGGNYVDALPWLQEKWKIARGRAQAFHPWDWLDATALIQASLAVGSNNTDIDVILDAMDAAVRRNRSAGMIGGQGGSYYPATDAIAAMAALQSGEREQGFVFLEAAVDQGEYIPLNFEFLRFIYDDPKFASILAKQEANQARERKKFLDVVCTNNPYADVWVPMKSTCSGYTAAHVN